MIEIRAGVFFMGTSDQNIRLLQLKESDWVYEWSDHELSAAEQPQHHVSLPAFEIAKYPVTNADYQTFLWDVGHRLPAEAEWECAARGMTVAYSRGEYLRPVAL